MMQLIRIRLDPLNKQTVRGFVNPFAFFCNSAQQLFIIHCLGALFLESELMDQKLSINICLC